MRKTALLCGLCLACASTKPAPRAEPAAPAAQPAPSSTEAAPVAPAQAPASTEVDEVEEVAVDIPAATERARKVLEAALKTKDPAVRGEVLAAVGAARQADMLKKLIAGLKAEEGEVRFGAARGLASLGTSDSTAVKAIAKAWKGEKGWAVKKELAKAAATCGVKELVPKLQAALSDPNQELQLAAAFALKDLGDPMGDEALAKLGNPPRKDVPKEGTDRWSRKVLAGKKEGDRLLAVKTLVQNGVREDIAVLLPQLDSADPLLSTWSAAAILRLAEKPVTAE